MRRGKGGGPIRILPDGSRRALTLPFGRSGKFLGTFLDHLVNDAEVLRHVRCKESIALQRVLDLLELLASVLGRFTQGLDRAEPVLAAALLRRERELL